MKIIKRTAFAIFILILSYFIYSALYPNESFYIEEFENNTAMAFPVSAVIIKKDATYPDIHGTYTSKAIIRLSPQDYQSVYLKLMADPVFKADTGSHPFLGDTMKFFETKDIDINKINTIFIGVSEAQFKVGFVNDNKTIVFERHSS